ncbi:MAG: acyltransferase family protein [Anaerolineales bacterium]|nr:acyltransferase family protein [Anaerolineales bacterium]
MDSEKIIAPPGYQENHPIHWLTNARIVAVFAVVLLHVSGELVIRAEIGSFPWWIGNVFDSLSRWCVPVLVMVSGALLLDKSKKETALSFYRKRLSRVFWPIVFWSAFFLLWSYAKGVLRSDPPTFTALGESILAGRPYVHLWYLYMILGLYFLTPFLRKIYLLSSAQELKLLIAMAFLISVTSVAYRAAFPTGGFGLFTELFLPYLPYFLLGYVVSAAEPLPWQIPAAVFASSVMLTAVGCFLVSQFSDLDAGLYFYNYLSLTVVPMSVSAIFLLKHWNRPFVSEAFGQGLASLTIGVFLIHPIFIEILNYWKLGVFAYTPYASIPVTAVSVFIISIFMSYLISRIPIIKRII